MTEKSSSCPWRWLLDHEEMGVIDSAKLSAENVRMGFPDTRDWSAVALRGALWALILWPAWSLFGLIHQYAINAPFNDDFMTMSLFDKALHDKLILHDFFAAQMEHRIAWPRLVMMAFYKWCHGHYFIAQVWYSYVLVFLTFVNVCVLMRQSIGSLRQAWPVLALASLALFSPVHFNVLLWPFMHQVVTLAFFLTAAVVVWQTGWPVALRFALALFCALCGTLSFSSGILIWLVLIPVIWLCAPRLEGRTRLLAQMAWLLAFTVTAGLYFHGLKNEVDPVFTMNHGDDAVSKELSTFASDPAAELAFAVRLLGSPLMRGNSSMLMDSSLRVGIALLVLYGICLGWWIWRFRDAELRRRLLPWLAVGAYSIGTALAIAMGRSWVSVSGNYALEPRYVIHAAPLLVALPVLCLMAGNDLRARFLGASRFILILLVLFSGVLATLELTAWTYGEQMMAVWSSARMRGAVSTLFYKTNCGIESEYVDNPPLARMADDLRLLKPPMLKNLRLDNFKIFPSPLSEKSAELKSVRTEDSEAGLMGVADGRAMFKNSRRVPDGIFLAYEAGEDHWEIFHVCHVKGLPLYLNGVIERDLEFSYAKPGGITRELSTFSARFPLNELPQGTWKISAWAYDFQNRHLGLVPGAFEVNTLTGTVRALGGEPVTVGLQHLAAHRKKSGGSN